MLTQDCVLCAAAASAPLCAACLADLPFFSARLCPRCAQPVTANTTGGLCAHCLQNPPALDEVRALWPYVFPVDHLIQQLKFAHRLILAPWFARQLLAAGAPLGDALLPMPLSAERLRERGFNQTVEIARDLARALQIPLLREGVRHLDRPPQSTLPWQARAANVRNAFECTEDFSGKTVLVLDDVMTTGSTLNALADTLKRHGARRVHAWVLARALPPGECDTISPQR